MSSGHAVHRPDGTRILVADGGPEASSLARRAWAADGFAVGLACELARLQQDQLEQPVLILSCVSDDLAQADCLDLGAQGYPGRPCQLADMLARVRVRLREGGPKDDGPGPDEIIRVGRLSLDTGRLRADAGAGPVPLTRLEFLFLRLLMEHVGQAVPKSQLLASVWDLDFDPGSNVVDVCVRRLRSKLGFDLIKTVRGSGYQLVS